MRWRISEQNQLKPMVQADQNDIRGSSFSIATTALAMGLVSQPTSQAGSRVGSPLGSPVSSTPGTPDSDRSSIDERYRTSKFKSQLTVQSRNPWTVLTDTEWSYKDGLGLLNSPWIPGQIYSFDEIDFLLFIIISEYN